MAKYVYSKSSNTGIVLNEDKAKFEMVWHKEKRIEEKLKFIEDIYKGDGGVFLKS